MNTLCYFVSGYTARGMTHMLDSNLTGLEHLWVLQGGPPALVSALLDEIRFGAPDAGADLESLRCPLDPDASGGLIWRKAGLGILDGECLALGGDGTVLQGIPDLKVANLGAAFTLSTLQQDRLQQLRGEIAQSAEGAVGCLAQALEVHDAWEEIYIRNMDFSMMNQLAAVLTQTCFGDAVAGHAAGVRHRFLGAATPRGAVDFVPNLTQGLGRRYFIKGRPGTGKSTLLTVLAADAETRGFYGEVYHCGFDPGSLDMIIFRELNLAVLDSTAPHEYFPNRPGDEIVDVYEAAVRPGTDEDHGKELKQITRAYREKIREATAFLGTAKALTDQMDDVYGQALDREKWAALRAEITRQIAAVLGG